jgi:hypothetical protein
MREAPLYCSKLGFKHHKMALEAAASKAKGRVLWHNDHPTPEINSMAVMIDWFTASGNYNQWSGGSKQNCTTKLGITNDICQIIKKIRESPLKEQGGIYT